MIGLHVDCVNSVCSKGVTSLFSSFQVMMSSLRHSLALGRLPPSPFPSCSRSTLS
ncbi:hypothetical protein LDENG_00241960 [Lucifuga dentata]|nr:hypothetical protein LDENG_00241960 [Lucifuga dentata]